MNEADADSKVHDLAEALSALGKELLCPICLCLLEDPVRLSCNHSFCKNCLEIYLFKKAICPICKKRQTKRVFAVSESLVTIITNYRTLASPSALSLSQPLSPEKQYHSILGVTDLGESPTKEKISEIHHSIETTRLELLKKERGSYVWLVTGLSASERRIINHVCTHSSVRVVHEYCEEVTHCITSSKEARGSLITKRTLNYLVAILEHIPIVSIKWVKKISRMIDSMMNELRPDSMTIMVKQEQFPPIDMYWIRGDEQCQKCILGSPQRSLQNRCVGRFTPPAPSRESIMDLIKHGGGTVLQELDSNQSQAIMIGDGTVAESFNSNLYVSYFWLLDCISNYRIEDGYNYLLH
ncbi:hypothetical protein WA171_005620 [Blastocystis sp. BT1]